MNTKQIMLGVALASLNAAGCSERIETDSSSNPEQPAQVGSFFVVTKDAIQLLGHEAQVSIRYSGPAKPADVEISIVAGNESGLMWTALSRISGDSRPGALITASITDGELQPGTAAVQRWQGSGERARATSGQYRIAVDAARISGSIEASPMELGARVEGPFAVRCFVPPELLPQGTGRVVAPTPIIEGATVRVLDERLESEFCRQRVQALTPGSR